MNSFAIIYYIALCLVKLIHKRYAYPPGLYYNIMKGFSYTLNIYIISLLIFLKTSSDANYMFQWNVILLSMKYV